MPLPLPVLSSDAWCHMCRVAATCCQQCRETLDCKGRQDQLGLILQTRLRRIPLHARKIRLHGIWQTPGIGSCTIVCMAGDSSGQSCWLANCDAGSRVTYDIPMVYRGIYTRVGRTNLIPADQIRQSLTTLDGYFGRRMSDAAWSVYERRFCPGFLLPTFNPERHLALWRQIVKV